MIQIELPGGGDPCALDADPGKSLRTTRSPSIVQATNTGGIMNCSRSRKSHLRLHATHRHAEKSFNGLSGIVTQYFEADLFSGHLFPCLSIASVDFVKIPNVGSRRPLPLVQTTRNGTFEKLNPEHRRQLRVDSAELVRCCRGVQIEGSRRRKRYSINDQKAA